jgi:hypothetical protein
MVNTKATPDDPRTDPPPTAGERETLEAFLDWYRATIRLKATGVADDDARRRLVPSATTLGGIVKHLRWVELNWFEVVLAGRDRASLPTPPWTDDDPDADFRMEPHETLDELLELYDAQCARSREIAATRGLDDVGRHRRLGQVSLRWIYVHMIEETARHAGHADILRELTDGATGD